MVVCQAYTRRPFGSARAPEAAVAAGCAAAVAGGGVLNDWTFEAALGEVGTGPAGPAGTAGAPPPQAASSTRLVVLPASVRKLRRDITRARNRSGVRSACDFNEGLLHRGAPQPGGRSRPSPVGYYYAPGLPGCQ